MPSGILLSRALTRTPLGQVDTVGKMGSGVLMRNRLFLASVRMLLYGSEMCAQLYRIACRSVCEVPRAW